MAGEPDDVDAMIEPVVPSRHRWLAELLADTLRDDGRATQAELDRWLAGLQRLEDRGAFLFSVNDYAVICGRRPGDALRTTGATVRRPTSR